ncbi:hypothetical protein EV360DRAFT_72291 [Lentinula raphanica]|nr:hypothetical protein EV360DRAFT_72291 [Lentinula raphanica]
MLTPNNLQQLTVRWVAKSLRAFQIVQDCGYQWLQKEGRPNQYVPSKETVARDVKKLYAAAKERLANLRTFSCDNPEGVLEMAPGGDHACHYLSHMAYMYCFGKALIKLLVMVKLSSPFFYLQTKLKSQFFVTINDIDIDFNGPLLWLYKVVLVVQPFGSLQQLST